MLLARHCSCSTAVYALLVGVLLLVVVVGKYTVIDVIDVGIGAQPKSLFLPYLSAPSYPAHLLLPSPLAAGGGGGGGGAVAVAAAKLCRGRGGAAAVEVGMMLSPVEWTVNGDHYMSYGISHKY